MLFWSGTVGTSARQELARVEGDVEARRAGLAKLRGERLHLVERRVRGPQPDRPEAEPLERAAIAKWRQAHVEGLEALAQPRQRARRHGHLENPRAARTRDVGVVRAVGRRRRAGEERSTLAGLVEQRVDAGVDRVAERLEQRQRPRVETPAPGAVGRRPHTQARFDDLRQLAQLAREQRRVELVREAVIVTILGGEWRAAPRVQMRTNFAGPRAGQLAQHRGAFLRGRHLIAHQVRRADAEAREPRLEHRQQAGVRDLELSPPRLRPLVVGLSVDAHQNGGRFRSCGDTSQGAF